MKAPGTPTMMSKDRGSVFFRYPWNASGGVRWGKETVLLRTLAREV